MREAPQHSRAFQIVRFADFEVDLRGRELRRNGARIPLQEQPFQVLSVLPKHAGEVVTREEFRQHLWPSDTGNTDELFGTDPEWTGPLKEAFALGDIGV